MHRFEQNDRKTRTFQRRSMILGGGLGGAVIAIQLVGASGASAATIAVPPILQAIKQCESGGSYTAVNPSSGASGAYQFLTSTWQSLSASAGYATAAAAPAAVQGPAAIELYNEAGTTPWVSSESCWGSVATTTAPTTSPTTAVAAAIPVEAIPVAATAAAPHRAGAYAQARPACPGGRGRPGQRLAGFGPAGPGPRR